MKMSLMRVRIDKVVLVSIEDKLTRNLNANRMIGTLLGTRDMSENVVEISKSIVVIHREGNNEVAIDIEAAKELHELHRKMNPNESIVGWFATGGGAPNEYSMVIHDYYWRETSNPIHLTVDPSDDGIQFKAYISWKFGVPGKHTGKAFVELNDVSIDCDTEMVGLPSCLFTTGLPHNPSKPLSAESDLEVIMKTIEEAQQNIAEIVKYINENILSGNKSMASNSNLIGNQLMSMVEEIIPFSGEGDDAFFSYLNDHLLLFVDLTKISKNQLLLNEKLLSSLEMKKI